MPHSFLDLRRIRYVLAIAEHGSISAAARALHVAQPALSYHLTEIEGQIGARLFDRLKTGIKPTHLGTILITHGRLILEATQVAEDDIRLHAGVNQDLQTIHLAIIPSLASTLAPALIAAFTEHLPTVSLHVIDARSGIAGELVDNGKADIAVQLVSSPDMKEEPLAWEDLYCVTQADDGAGQIDFASMAASRLVLPSKDNPLRRFLEDAADKEGLSIKVHMEVDGFEPRKRVVLAGLGTTVIGARSIFAENLGPDLVARRIVNPELRRPIIMKSRKGLDLALQKRIRTILVEVFKKTG